MIPIIEDKSQQISELTKTNTVGTSDYAAVVQEILDNVKERGDAALIDYTAQFDGAEIAAIRVSEEEITDGMAKVDPAFLQVLQRAKANISEFHEKQVTQGFMLTRNGAVMGQRVLPLAKVGVYVPGGTAAYPSTVLMNVIPAKIAGVQKIVLVTPPLQDGSVNPAILAAAKVAGVDEIYRIGGAQAVAALAYGTESVPQVDKIVGPGNIYVAAAKRLVYGTVDIDMIAGPSDVLIVADETANPVHVAADLLAQAEHDVNAQAILVTTQRSLAEATQKEVAQQTEQLPRKAIIEQSIAKNGKIILVENLERALAVANEIAPEHLELAVADPFAWLDQVENAGSVFLGHNTPEVLGDYLAGPNHTLPTERTARFYSPLSVDDFVKHSQYLYYGEAAMKAVADDVILFAETEGLGGHANSIRLRKGE
ncbi:histidinol dehydrogenase [Enterococcus asini ATCC 700915]|uniref:Histidinol dehydrogenase n=2 Tax=Enterococcus asini ATCC 700915 TaxID=1158606 RepID=R2S7U9_9ENTE|nr:histidinol dehydrogenase [Enterococcus asini]EOH91625.1 histidinol dehydrogenase [Enterococcus asini ATCC 700915]EOT57215.1 histidinol dehydrogenase [Enterococcus asini ATCC 700915]